MGEIEQSGGSYGAISEEEGGRRKAGATGKGNYSTESAAYNRATWYVRTSFVLSKCLIIALVSPKPPESTQDIPERKLCPPPVASFIGRKHILDKMRRYFDSESASQRVFVLHGLGGAGKSQLAFKFIEESKSKLCASFLT